MRYVGGDGPSLKATILPFERALSCFAPSGNPQRLKLRQLGCSIKPAKQEIPTDGMGPTAILRREEPCVGDVAQGSCLADLPPAIRAAFGHRPAGNDCRARSCHRLGHSEADRCSGSLCRTCWECRRAGSGVNTARPKVCRCPGPGRRPLRTISEFSSLFVSHVGLNVAISMFAQAAIGAR